MGFSCGFSTLGLNLNPYSYHEIELWKKAFAFGRANIFVHAEQAGQREALYRVYVENIRSIWRVSEESLNRVSASGGVLAFVLADVGHSRPSLHAIEGMFSDEPEIRRVLNNYLHYEMLLSSDDFSRAVAVARSFDKDMQDYSVARAIVAVEADCIQFMNGIIPEKIDDFQKTLLQLDHLVHHFGAANGLLKSRLIKAMSYCETRLENHILDNKNKKPNRLKSWGLR